MVIVWEELEVRQSWGINGDGKKSQQLKPFVVQTKQKAVSIHYYFNNHFRKCN